eukprot:6611032-Ditylum_brightwellii.AAC.1
MAYFIGQSIYPKMTTAFDWRKQWKALQMEKEKKISMAKLVRLPGPKGKNSQVITGDAKELTINGTSDVINDQEMHINDDAENGEVHDNDYAKNEKVHDNEEDDNEEVHEENEENEEVHDDDDNEISCMSRGGSRQIEVHQQNQADESLRPQIIDLAC